MRLGSKDFYKDKQALQRITESTIRMWSSLVRNMQVKQKNGSLAFDIDIILFEIHYTQRSMIIMRRDDQKMKLIVHLKFLNLNKMSCLGPKISDMMIQNTV